MRNVRLILLIGVAVLTIGTLSIVAQPSKFTRSLPTGKRTGMDLQFHGESARTSWLYFHPVRGTGLVAGPQYSIDKALFSEGRWTALISGRNASSFLLVKVSSGGRLLSTTHLPRNPFSYCEPKLLAIGADIGIECQSNRLRLFKVTHSGTGLVEIHLIGPKYFWDSVGRLSATGPPIFFRYGHLRNRFTVIEEEILKGRVIEVRSFSPALTLSGE
jgi:hypothetical protein